MERPRVRVWALGRGQCFGDGDGEGKCKVVDDNDG